MNINEMWSDCTQSMIIKSNKSHTSVEKTFIVAMQKEERGHNTTTKSLYLLLEVLFMIDSVSKGSEHYKHNEFGSIDG